MASQALGEKTQDGMRKHVNVTNTEFFRNAPEGKSTRRV